MIWPRLTFLTGRWIYVGEELGYSEIVTYWNGKSMREAFVDKETKGNQLQELLRRKYTLIRETFAGTGRGKGIIQFYETIQATLFVYGS